MFDAIGKLLTTSLITNGLSNLLGSIDATVIDAMQVVMGLRPYVSKSKDLTTFRERW